MLKFKKIIIKLLFDFGEMKFYIKNTSTYF